MRYGWLAAALAILAARPAGAQVNARTDAPVDARVDSILRLMTLEEKVGQMTQLTIQAVARTHGTATVDQELDSAKLEDVLVRHQLGSMLNVYDVAITPRQWRDVIGAVQRFAGRTRLRIPVIYGIDAVHGDHYMRGATVFPQNIAMAATWDPWLVRREHQITAYETRASGIPWNFAPVLDLGRQPLWSRFFETYGEDVHLATVMGTAAILGEQRDPRPSLDSLLPAGRRRSTLPHSPPVFVAATGKHFLGYSMPLSGTDRTVAWIPDRMLREYYLPTFATAIDSGLRTVMINSSDVNGVPVHASHEILTDLLRGELHFTGVAVSDWADIIRLHTVHHVAATDTDAVRMAVMAGIDMSMVPQDLSFYDDLVALVRQGKVPQSRIDESVRRILRLKFELGLFDNAAPDTAMLANTGAPAFQAVSRTAAEEAVTLLKNDRGLLPLAKTAKVVVTGPGAASLVMQYGSWSFTWQGTDSAMYPHDVHTLLDAIRSRAKNVTYASDSAAAVEAARHADVAIVCLAESPSVEKVGDIDDLMFSEAQLRLARAIEATGTPVVLTLFHGRPRIVRAAVDSARAVVTAYQLGPFAGEALAGVLFGDVNPSGKLPFTWPRTTGKVVPYDHALSSEVQANDSLGAYRPEWPFGYGLSYTTFGYSDLTLARSQVGRSDTIGVTVTVVNTGKRLGTEVVQLYVRQLYASVAPPVKRLRAFERVTLAPGERRTVLFKVPVHDLAFVGRDDRWVVEPGAFDVIVGGLTDRLTVVQ
ncbi:MAG TPA: glycoside hydrolase family 3 N-terminal domain-containing protein [Gemmatimonadaceae bacterium]|nr:glycoside hydrolase family 3 N-terminal domain-containing protein [Gemmatimonadaceae bacterium]